MSSSSGLEIDPRDFLRKLRKVDKDAANKLARAARPIVAKVRDEVRDQMPARSGSARKQIKSGFDQRGAFVKMDKKSGKGAPYVAWLDFGGVLKPTGRRFNTITRARAGDGRYLYPTAKAHADETKAALDRAWGDVLRDAGLS